MPACCVVVVSALFGVPPRAHWGFALLLLLAQPPEFAAVGHPIKPFAGYILQLCCLPEQWLLCSAMLWLAAVEEVHFSRPQFDSMPGMAWVKPLLSTLITVSQAYCPNWPHILRANITIQ